jgi:anti-sigma28 factor (negative regulator of flagellin synthesis)
VHPHDIERGAEPAVSITSEDLRIGIEAVRAADAVSEALVSALRSQLVSGRYQPAAEAVAERMLSELALWRPVGRRHRSPP